MNDLLNHLWQSTAFAAVIAIACLALRSNHARVRFRLWLAASLKFLIPFSLLVSLGDRLDVAAANPPLAATTVERISATYAPAQMLAAVPAGAAAGQSPHWLLALGVIWVIGAAFVLGRWLRQWLRLRASMRSGKPLSPELPVPVVLTRSAIEPGIFGVMRPVLLLPEGLTTTLTPAQLNGIIAHELCHVRARDNLLAMLHMLVEAIFWFHPLVWWIGAKLIEERERACDESVIAQGNSADDYAAGILGVCRFYLESPLPCTAGITGSELKKRIHEIMTGRLSARLTLRRKALLAVTGCAVCAVPLAIGVLRAQTLTFEVASIKPSDPDARGVRLQILPGGGFKGDNVPLRELIQFAYEVQPFQIEGGPKWLNSEGYDILAKAPKSDLTEADVEQLRQRVRALLAERFQLAVRQEKKEVPVYALVVAKNGPKLKQSENTAPGSRQMMRGRPGDLTAEGIEIRGLATFLSRSLERPVIDKTGLTGKYDFSLQWTPERRGPDAMENAPAPDPMGASIFTAIQEQLGLKLESQKGMADVVVIERAEEPTEN